MACIRFPDKVIKQILLLLRHIKSITLTSHTHSQPAKAKAKANYEEAFRRLDTNGDGKVSTQELHSFFAWSGDSAITYAEVESTMKDLDSDEDGSMDYGDFLKLMEMGEEEDLRRAFEVFEEGLTGCITPAGLQSALSGLGEARSFDECVAMVGAYDLDGNGVLDFHEFRTMMIIIP